MWRRTLSKQWLNRLTKFCRDSFPSPRPQFAWLTIPTIWDGGVYSYQSSSSPTQFYDRFAIAVYGITAQSYIAQLSIIKVASRYFGGCVWVDGTRISGWGDTDLIATSSG